jgi:hypothetical protein
MKKLLLLSLMLIISVACSGPQGPTKAEIWNSRIGTYSYAEAVGEFGPPDNKETLGDGVVVAAWISMKKNRSTTTPVKNLYTGKTMYYRSSGGGIKTKKTILTFGEDKKLKAWKFRVD